MERNVNTSGSDISRFFAYGLSSSSVAKSSIELTYDNFQALDRRVRDQVTDKVRYLPTCDKASVRHRTARVRLNYLRLRADGVAVETHQELW